MLRLACHVIFEGVSLIFLQAKCNLINFRRSNVIVLYTFIWGILIGSLVDPTNRNLGVRYERLHCKMMLCWTGGEACLPVTRHLRAITRPPGYVMYLNVIGLICNRTLLEYIHIDHVVSISIFNYRHGLHFNVEGRTLFVPGFLLTFNHFFAFVFVISLLTQPAFCVTLFR